MLGKQFLLFSEQSLFLRLEFQLFVIELLSLF